MTGQIRQLDSELGHVELCNIPAPGKPRSEDLVQTAGSAAWLFDGTSAHDDPHACDQHDGVWFVEQLSQALADELTRAPPHPLVADALAAAITRVASSHSQLCPDTRRGHGPSATAVVVRRRAEELEYLVLGDSALLVQTHDGQVHHHSDKRLSTVEPRLRKSIHLALHAGRGYDDAAHRERVRRLRASERVMRNREHGFWIAADDSGAPLRSLTGSYSLGDTSAGAARIALISDGLERAITHLRCYRDWRQLLETLFRLGAPGCITRLRQAEQADPRGSRHPRTRPSDDAAAITCVMTP